MRLMESLLVLVLVAHFFVPLSKQKTMWDRFLPYIATLMLVLHLFVEGPRWQMYPLYGLTILVGGLAFIRRRQDPDERKPAWNIIGLVVTGLFILLPVLLPVPRVSAPSGPYRVGTTSMVLTDDGREEIYSGQAGQPRVIQIQVWYPADPEPNAELAPWMDHAEIVAPAVATYIKLPSFFLDHLKYAVTNSSLDAPVLIEGGPYPLLVFSHGWNGFRAQSTYLNQELASRGYIVVGIDHTYGAVVTVFPDGQAIYNNPELLPRDVPDEEYDQAAWRLGAQWAGDMSFVVDEFTSYNADPGSVWYGAVDLERVGGFGHSTGGGAAAQFCGSDPRCKAAFPMDPWLGPTSQEVIANGLNIPTMYMFSETFPRMSNIARLTELLANSTGEPPVITILGAAHYDFSDLPALSPLAPQLGLKGPIKGARVQKIITTFAIAFFDQALKGEPTSLLDGPSEQYPELIWGIPTPDH